MSIHHPAYFLTVFGVGRWENLFTKRFYPTVVDEHLRIVDELGKGFVSCLTVKYQERAYEGFQNENKRGVQF